MTIRAWLNRWRRRWAHALWHRRVFGEQQGRHALPHTRIAPSTCIDHEEGLLLADHVYIGPFNHLEASGGLVLEEGVQITSHCVLTTHSSHRALRLQGRAYATHLEAEHGPRPGWVAGPIHVGAYSFIGPHSVLEAGTRLGRGTLVCAGSVVRGHFPDFAVLQGQPAVVVGDTRQADAELLRQHPQWQAHRQAWADTDAGRA